MNARFLSFWQVVSAAVLIVAAGSVLSDEEGKTVIGPRNIHLYDGAHALIEGDGEKGVRLTLLGLRSAQGSREKKAAHSNLCAGYMMIEQLEKALEHCDWVLERYPDHWRTYNNRALIYLQLDRMDEAEADIRMGQEINPHSRKLKLVKSMYLDKTEPVVPHIEIDERRNPPDEKDGDPPG